MESKEPTLEEVKQQATNLYQSIAYFVSHAKPRAKKHKELQQECLQFIQTIITEINQENK